MNIKDKNKTVVAVVGSGLTVAGVVILTVFMRGVSDNQKIQFPDAEIPVIDNMDDSLKLYLQGDQDVRKIAFFMQKSKIREDGSIKNPKYFMSLPIEYRHIIIRLKDYGKYSELFHYCLRLKINKNEKIIFEEELLNYRFNDNQKVK